MIPITVLRQSAAELLAYAVTDLFPGVILVKGNVTEFGFYYDFIAEQKVDSNAISLIEEKVRTLAKQDLSVRTIEMMRENAANLFNYKGQTIIADAVSAARENIVTIFQIDDFYDYCPAPYISSTGEVAAFKILKIESLTSYIPGLGETDVIRIRGAVYQEKDLLKAHIKGLKAAKKVDHRLLGKELDLFGQHDNVSTNVWFWHPNGANLRQSLIDLWQDEHRRQGYEFLVSPSFVKETLLKKAGFFEIFPETVNSPSCTMEGENYLVPSSLSPQHAVVFHSKLHSYREMPVRFAECAQVSAASKQGVLWGILNNQLVHADYTHIFCTQAQLQEELISSLQFIDKFIKIFGFEYHWCLGGRGHKFAGTISLWKKTQEIFVKAFEASSLKYTYCEHETLFAGPLAEARLIDAIGREWKGPQIGIDFNCPERFGLKYQGPDDEMHVPVMLIRSLYGSLERFAAILTEHYAGQFPVWLAPEQVRVIPVLGTNISYAEEVYRALVRQGYRAGIDCRHEQLGAKIHSAELRKVPFMVIVGDKEEKQRLITVRSRGHEVAGAAITLEDFLLRLQEDIMLKR